MEKLSSLEGLTSKRMFGGHGIFKDGKMFCIINSKEQYYLKVNDSNRPDFVNKESNQHARMSYFSIPEVVFNNHQTLIKWVKKSITAIK